MLTLSLLRHAKSSWDDPALADHDRPLNDRGRRDAPRMAQFIRDNDLTPTKILCSTSERTRQTLAILQRTWRRTPPVDFVSDLYLAEPSGLLRIIRSVLRSPKHLMLIGHNPGLQDFAVALIDKASPKSRREMVSKFPTAALAVITFDTEKWRDVGLRQGRLEVFMTPRRLD